MKQLTECSGIAYKFPKVPGESCVITENNQPIASANTPDDAEVITTALAAARKGVDHQLAVNVLGSIQSNVAFSWELNARNLIVLLSLTSENVTSDKIKSDLISKFTDICDECFQKIEETGDCLSCIDYTDHQRI